jgi:hypothetical protein
VVRQAVLDSRGTTTLGAGDYRFGDVTIAASRSVSGLSCVSDPAMTTTNPGVPAQVPRALPPKAR